MPICLSRNIQRRKRHYTVPPILGIEVSRELWSASCFAVPDIPRFFKMGLLDMDFLDDVRRMNPRQVKITNFNIAKLYIVNTCDRNSTRHCLIQHTLAARVFSEQFLDTSSPWNQEIFVVDRSLDLLLDHMFKCVRQEMYWCIRSAVL